MIVRVIAGLDEAAILRNVQRAMRDPEVDSVVVHRGGSRFSLPDGREVVVSMDGRIVLEHEPVGAC